MTNVRQYLGDAKFPASKRELIDCARSHNAPTDVITTIEKMSDRSYRDLSEVVREVSL
ncbi:MAG: DUF2795 domain-containing protein [Bdellovibrionota bacterium]